MLDELVRMRPGAGSAQPDNQIDQQPNNHRQSNRDWQQQVNITYSCLLIILRIQMLCVYFRN